MATLNYMLFATHDRQCQRAHYTKVHKKKNDDSMRASFPSLYCAKLQ